MEVAQILIILIIHGFSCSLSIFVWENGLYVKVGEWIELRQNADCGVTVYATKFVIAVNDNLKIKVRDCVYKCLQ